MDAADASDTLIAAKHRHEEELLFSRWCVGYQFEMSLEEFKKKLKPAKYQSKKEILAEVEASYEAFSGGFKELDYGNL